MLYLDAPLPFKDAMFREAARLGARSIRVDVSLPEIVRAPGRRDWRGLDEDVALAREYGLGVSAVLLGTPWWLADCPRRTALAASYRCPPARPETWARYVTEVVARAGGAIDTWEVWNEPDQAWAFDGTAEQYAALLRATHDAVEWADPAATVVLGGMGGLRSRPWLARVLAAAPGSFDVAGVHVRGRLDRLAAKLSEWRSFLAGEGFDGPVWVTEHGYPSQTRWQDDPAFRGGPCAQAAYLARSVPTLLAAGAQRVYVTERDNLHGRFSTEGLVGGSVTDPPSADPRAEPKPAAAVVARAWASGPASPPATTPATRRGPCATGSCRSRASDPAPRCARWRTR
jgi:hypothetical protein